MSSQTDLEELVLISPERARLLASLAEYRSLSLSAMDRLRREFGPESFQAASRIVKARDKAHDKFPNAGRLWLDSVRVEQATHQFVARNKASRFAGKHVVDLCCGIGGDTFALAAQALSVVAVDLDSDCLRRLTWNLDQLSLSGNVCVVKADASFPPVPDATCLHIDPDRRSLDVTKRPTFRLDQYRPGVKELTRLMGVHPGGAVKLSPGSDFETLESAARTRGIRTEIEVVSLFGECKEATLWFGELAGPRARTATILPAGVHFSGDRPRAVGVLEYEDRLGSWVHEVDPAMTRAGLVELFARESGLNAALPDGAFLTSAECHTSPWLTGFEVVAKLQADRKILRSKMKELGWKTAVVKTRGGEGANRFLSWFDQKPTGTTRETLLVWSEYHGAARAILALRAMH